LGRQRLVDEMPSAHDIPSVIDDFQKVDHALVEAELCHAPGAYAGHSDRQAGPALKSVVDANRFAQPLGGA
jgi:hypothetical protein